MSMLSLLHYFALFTVATNFFETGTIRLLIKLKHLALQISLCLLLYLSMLFLATAQEHGEQIVIVGMQT